MQWLHEGRFLFRNAILVNKVLGQLYSLTKKLVAIILKFQLQN
jgi:hypothetical protein